MPDADARDAPDEPEMDPEDAAALENAKELLEQGFAGENWVESDDPMDAMADPDGETVYIETGNHREGKPIRIPFLIVDPGNTDLGTAMLFSKDKKKALLSAARAMVKKPLWIFDDVPVRVNGKYPKGAVPDRAVKIEPRLFNTTSAMQAHLRLVLLRKAGVSGPLVEEMVAMETPSSTKGKSSTQSPRSTASGPQAESGKEQPPAKDSAPTTTSKQGTKSTSKTSPSKSSRRSSKPSAARKRTSTRTT